MILKLLYFCIFVTLLSINNIDGSYSVCGNWQTYRDEKCIQIFNTQKMVTFDEALKSCSQMDNSSQILTIHSKEEQDFLTEYLFETQKLVDNIWIGLRNKTKIFEWTDSSTKSYTNWKKENPTNKPDNNCVQLDSDSSKGQWMNEPCIKKGLVVCQKLPELTLSDLLKQIIETKERLTKTESELKETKDQLKISLNERNEIFNFILKNQNLSDYYLFTDINGKNKAFIMPFEGTKEQTFDDAVNLCKNFNSTLIEIESKEKQLHLESFLSRFEYAFLYKFLPWIWINGLRDSSGIWKWLKSNTTFTFTNWQKNYPIKDSTNNNIFITTCTTGNETFGKWETNAGSERIFSMCELSFGFS